MHGFYLTEYTNSPRKAYAYYGVTSRHEIKALLKRSGIQSILSSRELNEFRGLKTHKRRTEWLLGRYCVKKAAQLLNPKALPLSSIEIKKNKHGQPKARAGKTIYSVSISHSGGAAIGGAATIATIGVDIEELRPLRPGVSEFVLGKNLPLDNAKLIRLWSLKEAAYKLSGRGKFLPHSIKIRQRKGNYSILGESTTSLSSFIAKGYAVSIAIRP